MSIRWTIRPKPPVDRERILDAYRSVAQSMAGKPLAPARRISKGIDRGADLGYSAFEETWEAAIDDAALIWTISPILASMGVSGEFITVTSRGLAVPIRGRALCSARRPGYAVLESDDAALQAMFAARFGEWGKPNASRRRAVAEDQLREELAFRTLPAEDLHAAVAELVAQRAATLPDWLDKLEAMHVPLAHHLAALELIRSALAAGE